MLRWLTKPNPRPEHASYTSMYAANSSIPRNQSPVVICSSRRTTSVIISHKVPSAADDGHARAVILGASAAGVVKRTLRRHLMSYDYFWW